jgi:hypothetical protein
MKIERLDLVRWIPALRTAADLCTRTTDRPSAGLCLGVVGTVCATLRHAGVDCKIVAGAAIFRLSDYAHSIRWPNVAGTELYDLMQAVFAGMLSGHSDLITDSARYERFLGARRITAKFWDDWRRAIAENRLRCEDVARMFESNKRSIICLAVSELAMAEEFSFGPGEGKSWLFRLAQALTDLDPRHGKRWFLEVARRAKREGLVRGWKTRMRR